MDWQKFWQDVFDFFTGNVWRVVGFFAVLVIGFIIVKLIMRFIRRCFERGKMERITQKFLLAIIKFALYLVWILILLSFIGVEVGGVVTALSAIVLAVGLALEDNIANLADGIVIVTGKMFKKGDYVSIDGVEGSVDAINFLFTTIMTSDNKKITVPNASIVGGKLINYGANPTRRLEFTFQTAYESDVEKVKEVVTSVMRSDGRVLLEPNAPFCRLKTLNESSLGFFAHCWCDNADYWDVYYYIMENVYNEFKRNGIKIPYKQLEMRVRTDDAVLPINSEPLPERVEKQRPEEEKGILFDPEYDDLGEYISSRRARRAGKKSKCKSDK